MKILKFDFPLSMGMHARPASAFENIQSDYHSTALFKNMTNSLTASMNSAIALIGLAVREGDCCEILIEGDDENAFYKSLQQFIQKELSLIDESLSLDADKAGFISPLYYSFGGRAYEGIPLSVGKSIATGFLYQPIIHVPETSSPFDQGTQSEIALRVETLFDLYEKEMRNAASHCQGSQRLIVQAQLSLFNDPQYRDEIASYIQSGGSFYHSLQSVSNRVVKQFLDSENPIIKERASDITDISLELLSLAYPDAVDLSLNEPEHPYILMAEKLSPSLFLKLNLQFCQGIIVSKSGYTSHLAILARSFSIPLVSQLKNESQLWLELKQKSQGSGKGLIFIDGESGAVLFNPDKENIESYFLNIDQFRGEVIKSDEESLNPTVPHSPQLYVNVSSLEEVRQAAKIGVMGIGLFRTEMLYLERETLPSLGELSALFYELGKIMEGKRVVLRLPDIGGDKQSHLIPLPKEDNPFLGVRGVRLYPKIEPIILTFIQALATALVQLQEDDVYFSPALLIPMVSRSEEILWVRSRVERLLKEAGLTSDAVEIGSMIEIPSAALGCEPLAELSDFFSIGTNDLQQYLFAADRSLPALYQLKDSYHPAFINLLSHLIEQAKKAGITCSVCGEAAQEPMLFPFWKASGVSSLSVPIAQLSSICKMISAIPVEKINESYQKLLLDKFSGFSKTENWIHQSSSLVYPLFTASMLFTQTHFKSKEEILHHTSQLMKEMMRCQSASDVEKAFYQREEQWSTSLGFGFAIPHCKSESVIIPSLFAFTLKNPIIWDETEPEKLVSSVVLLAVPASDQTNRHLKIFATLARSIMREPFRESFLGAQTNEELFQFLIKQLNIS